MSKISRSQADYQTSPALFELEPVEGKKVVVDFTDPELSSPGGLTLVREYERSSCRILDRIESCIASQPTMTRLENRLSACHVISILKLKNGPKIKFQMRLK